MAAMKKYCRRLPREPSTIEREAFMVPLRQEVRIAVRTLLRAPAFSFTVVLTIAVAVGANTAVFSVTNAVLIRSLPFDAPDRLVWIASMTKDQPNYPFSLPEFIDYRERAKSLDALVAYTTWSAILGGTGSAERLQGIRISSSAFDVLGVKPAAGRLLNARDDDAAAARVAVVAFDLWQRRFGGRDAAIGTVALLNGEPFEIVGVLPRHFPLPGTIDVAVPLAPDRDPSRAARRSVNLLRFIGRLRPKVTPKQAEAELAAIAARLKAEHPDAYAAKTGIAVTPLQSHLVRNYARGLTLLTLASLVALLVACGNLVNVLLARATTRAADVRVRLALGARAFDVARASWIETFLLSAAGALLGVGLAAWMVRAFTRFGPADIPRLDEVALDVPVLGFAAMLMLLMASFLAVVPFWGVARRPSWSGSARDDGWSRRNGRLREAVIVGEAALAVMLLLASIVLLRSFSRLQAVDPGFPVERRVMARIALPRTAYRTPDSIARFTDRFSEKLQQIHGVENAGGINVAPLSGVLATVQFTVDGTDASDPRNPPSAHFRVVTDSYLAAMGIPLVQGRGFSEHDAAASAAVALINRHLAESLFAGENPVGRRIRIGDNTAGPRPLEIVGVVGDIRQMALDAPPSFDVYVPMRQAHPDVAQWLANNQFWVVRVSEDAPADVARAIRRALDEVDSTAGVAHIRPLEAYIDTALAQRRFSTILSGALAVIALTLVVVGLYGVMAYSVAQRTREIGLRTAVGATRFDIWCLVSRSALGMLAVGAALGLMLAVPALRPLQAVLFRTDAFEPSLVSAVVAGLIGIGMTAATVPAWRAARIDPSRALRE
jgi:putative ABC transport system permease protein